MTAARVGAERTASGEKDAFSDAANSGVSANLCEALVEIIDSFPTLNVNVSWARIRPNMTSNQTLRFGANDAPILRQVAHAFRERTPKPDIQLHGHVRLLTRGEDEEDGRIRLNAIVDGKQLSVTASLERQDYEQAVQAHKDKATVTLSGDLERTGPRWRLLNPRLKHILWQEESGRDD